MTGLGEPVYVEKNDAVAEMVEMVARTISRQGGCAESLEECCYCGPTQETRNNSDTCWNKARAALESLGIPLTVLVALKSGEWFAAPKKDTKEMREAVNQYCFKHITDDDSEEEVDSAKATAWDMWMAWGIMQNAAPKEP